MKKLKKFMAVLLCVLLCAGYLAGCVTQGTMTIKPIGGVAQLEPGQSVQFEAFDKKDNKITEGVTFSVTAETHATITAAGNLTLKATATPNAKIVVRAEHAKHKLDSPFEITVKAAQVQLKPLTLKTDAPTVEFGKPVQFSAESAGIPAAGAIYQVTAGGDYGFITASGLLRCYSDAPGGATITVKAMLADHADSTPVSVTVFVPTVNPSTMELTASSATVAPKGSVTISAKSGGIAIEGVLFTTDSEYAQVSSGGLLRCLSNAAVGEIITVTATKPGYDTETIDIEVIASGVELKELTLQGLKNTLVAGETLQIIALDDDGGELPGVVFSVSGAASISAGLVSVFKWADSSDEVTVTATLDGYFEAYFDITVTRAEDTEQNRFELDYSNNKVDLLDDTSDTLGILVFDTWRANQPVANPDLSYTVIDGEEFLEYLGDGFFQALGHGTAKVKVVFTDGIYGDYELTVTVTVVVPPSAIKLSGRLLSNETFNVGTGNAFPMLLDIEKYPDTDAVSGLIASAVNIKDSTAAPAPVYDAENETLKMSGESGTYKVTISSDSGTANKAREASAEFTVQLNSGVNVSDYLDDSGSGKVSGADGYWSFKGATEHLSIRTVNIMNDFELAATTQAGIRSFQVRWDGRGNGTPEDRTGDKTIEGNGFVIDYSGVVHMSGAVNTTTDNPSGSRPGGSSDFDSNHMLLNFGRGGGGGGGTVVCPGGWQEYTPDTNGTERATPVWVNYWTGIITLNDLNIIGNLGVTNPETNTPWKFSSGVDIEGYSQVYNRTINVVGAEEFNMNNVSISRGNASVRMRGVAGGTIENCRFEDSYAYHVRMLGSVSTFRNNYFGSAGGYAVTYGGHDTIFLSMTFEDNEFEVRHGDSNFLTLVMRMESQGLTFDGMLTTFINGLSTNSEVRGRLKEHFEIAGSKDFNFAIMSVHDNSTTRTDWATIKFLKNGVEQIPVTVQRVRDELTAGGFNTTHEFISIVGAQSGNRFTLIHVNGKYNP